MKKKSIAIIPLMLLLIGVVSCNKKTVDQDKPNVVLVFVDDMGYGDLACYGNPLIKTPNLDNMASEGIRMTSFYVAASVCTPSRAALLTGRYPIRNLPNNLGPESRNGLPLEEHTIANLLGDAGYTSMAIGKWHLGHMPEYLPTSRGFDKFFGLPYSNDMILPWCPWLSEKDTLFLYEDSKKIRIINYDQDDLTKMYTEKAVEFIDENAGRPFFLYLAHSMPHLPISTSREFRGKSEAGLYGDVIETLDWSMGKVLEAVDNNGLAKNTLVIFTSDNGPWHNLPERMLQRGVENWHSGSVGPFRGAKGTSYEGGHRVPAIIRWPGTVTDNMVISSVMTTMDLFSTIVDVCGAGLPANHKIDGTSALSMIKGEGEFKREMFFYFAGKHLHAVRKGEWKLRVTRDTGVELYNLLLDQSEKYNRAEELPEVVEELYREMKAFGEETGAILVEL